CPPGVQRVAADPRWLRVHGRVPDQPLLPRRQGARDRRGHQRDPAPRDRPRPGAVSTLESAQVAGSVLAFAGLLGTIISRLLPFGAWRRRAEDLAIVLGCAAPLIAITGPYLRGRIWPGADIISAAYRGEV